MKARDAAKLLGGYATGTLTAEERAALFAAAIEDQELFNALADEQALRDLLADPVARARLGAALGEPRQGFAALAAWWRRPAWRIAAAGAVVGLMAIVVVRVGTMPVERPQVAVLREERPAGLEAPAPRQEAAAQSAAAPASPAPKKKDAPAAPPRRTLEVAPPTAKKEVQADVAPPPALAPQKPQPAMADARTNVSADEAMPLAAAQVSAQDAGTTAPQERREGVMKTRAMAVRPSVSGGVARAGFAAAEAPQLRWQVLAAKGQNRVDALPQGATVGTGEAFRIEVSPAERGWVFILEPDGAGGWKRAGGGEAGPDRPLRFPASGTLQFDAPGRKVWQAVYSNSKAGETPVAGAVTISVEVVRR